LHHTVTVVNSTIEGNSNFTAIEENNIISKIENGSIVPYVITLDQVSIVRVMTRGCLTSRD
jgi:hypothetical protein